jgi:hypothetical protein
MTIVKMDKSQQRKLLSVLGITAIPLAWLGDYQLLIVSLPLGVLSVEHPCPVESTDELVSKELARPTRASYYSN